MKGKFMEENQEQINILDKQVENKPARDELGRLLPGNTANPNGRPKGQSLKEFWRQRLADMTNEEKEKWTKEEKVAAELIWRMAEGQPKQDIDASVEVQSKDRKSTRLNSSHIQKSRMPSSA